MLLVGRASAPAFTQAADRPTFFYGGHRPPWIAGPVKAARKPPNCSLLTAHCLLLTAYNLNPGIRSQPHRCKVMNRASNPAPTPRASQSRGCRRISRRKVRRGFI